MSTHDAVIAEARAWIGTSYHHQAAIKDVGCDCLGLVRGVWRALYGADPEQPPAYSRDWAETLRRETLAEAAGRHMIPAALDATEPGDLLLFAISADAPAKHCAILVAGDRMVHAVESHPVAEVALVPWWESRLRFAFCFPEI
jgi:NlpC/P60 family putative phage cell wall peptidase